MTASDFSEPPAEAVLIKEALRRARLSGREAARRAGISDARWRQIVAGHQVVSGVRAPVRAPDDTLARMAHAVGVTPDELRRTGRTEAADMLAALEAPPASPSVSSDFTSDPHIDAIASLLATLPPEAQEEVLRRVRLTEAAKPREEHTDNQFRRRAV